MKKLIIILILGSLCFGCSNQKLPNDLAFDSGVWKEANKRRRGRMAPDLEKSKLLVGKTKNEMEDLLGKIDFQNGEQSIYLIDVGEFYDYYFKINFDETGKVKSSFIGD